MRLDFVELSGFRGFREKVRVTFGLGFTVITGRNGVGKSTLFDAVEYALTGSIAKYAIEKAAQESLSDYLWWRGNGVALSHYVMVSFTTDAGERFSITRTRATGSDKTSLDIERALCTAARPEHALNQLCKTSIIRDEWIAALSLDLSELDRFEQVRGALGIGQEADFAAKAKAVLKAAEAIHSSRVQAYDELRAQLSMMLTRLAQQREAVVRAGDVSAAMRLVANASPDARADVIAQVEAGRAALARRRSRLGAMGEAVFQAREIQSYKRQLGSPEADAQRQLAQQAFNIALREMENATRSFEEAKRALEIEERGNDIAASLAILIEHGERLGLHDDTCPLCAAERSAAEFAAGIALARKRISILSSGIVETRAAAASARETVARASAAFEQARSALSKLESDLAVQGRREAAHMRLIEDNDIDPRFAMDPDGLEIAMEEERSALVDLERALLTLEVSQSVATVASLEDGIGRLRAAADQAAQAVEASEKAQTRAKAIDRAVRSVSGELMDERLAQISPLLNELYQRLRPHFDWRSIEYAIRGDVRRFLSLKVGDGLNPQFVFSSGQRRAAGLAFLLSVHLARPWTHWRTLMMDDPVQHIDDFRALQLIEVLSALRMAGRQIICAVEDEALANLLCRRLLSTSESVGKRLSLEIGPAGATTVASEIDVPPMPSGVLSARSEFRVVA